MSEHPTIDVIERFAIGAMEADDDFVTHVAGCDVCSAQLAREARLELALGEVKRGRDDMRRDRGWAVRVLSHRGLPALLVLAAAALLFLILRAPQQVTEIRAETQVGAATAIADAPPVPGADTVIAGLRPKFRSCYQAGLAENPVLSGRVVIEAVVDPSGGVQSATATTTEGLSPPVVACLVDVVRGARFDATPRGSSLRVPVSFVQTK